MKNISQGIISATIGGALALGGFHFLSEKNNNTKNITIPQAAPPIQLSSAAPLSAAMPTFEAAAEKTVNSVVHIKTVSTREGTVTYDPFQDFFFGQPHRKAPSQQVAGSGSGVIISEDGFIATNNHVVEGATEIEVTLNDKKTYKATIVGNDPTTDLALIKIEEKDLPAIFYGNSDNVNIGEWVLAVGNPFNLNSTVTAGIVSAKGRNINILKEDYAIESFIQTDAAVNPGNSGGALVNQNGELIGINTAIASNTGSYTGYSFAVPVNMVKKIMGDLAKFGTVQRALLGVQIRDINQELAEEISTNDLKGVYISKVIDNGAANMSGLEEGDIIRKVGSTIIHSTAELQEQIGQFRPGDKVNVTFERDGIMKTADVVLRNKLGTTESIEKEVMFLGAKLDKPSKKELKSLGLEKGVKVSDLELGKLMREGIKKGFIITSINNNAVNSPEEVISMLKEKKGGVLIEGIYPSGARAYYGFGM